MDAKGADHLARVRHLREEFSSANERLVKRLRAAEDHAAERVPDDGGWSAAQVGWHVATVNTRFAALLSGDVPAAKPLPDDFTEKPWKEIAAELPEKIQAVGRGDSGGGGHEARRDRGARSVGGEDGARLRHADAGTRRAHRRHESAGRHDQPVSGG